MDPIGDDGGRRLVSSIGWLTLAMTERMHKSGCERRSLVAEHLGAWDRMCGQGSIVVLHDTFWIVKNN
jgi:hypothetical protein